MAKIYGQIERAQFEVKSSDYATGVVALVWWNTTEGRLKSDDGATVRAFLRNDTKCVVGNHATAANNIRFHRGASGVLQFVTGDNATAEGTLATTLNQISFRAENYTTGARPAAANSGRIIWNTTTGNAQGDTGAGWVDLGIGTNTVLDANFRQSAGLSVVGRSANTTGNTADITGVDGQVLRVSGTTLGFGTIVAAGLASNSVTTVKITDANVTLAKLDATANLSVAKAWATFTGVQASGTYGRSGTTITNTLASHGMTTGQKAYLTFSAGTGGTATSGFYTITNTGTNTFTVTDTASGSITGSPAVSRDIWLKASYGITSIARAGTGSYDFVQSVTADANFALSTSCSVDGGYNLVDIDSATPPTSTTFRLSVVKLTGAGAPVAADPSRVSITIFGN